MAKTDNQRLNATVTIGGALSNSFRGAITSSRKQIARVGDAIKELKTREQRLSKVADHWEKQGRDARQYREEIERVNTQLGKLRRSEERMGRLRKAQQANVSRRGELRGQLFDAVAIGATASAPIAAAIHFESTMADLNKVANLTPKRLKAVRKQILGMSREMPMAADQIGAIMTAAAQSNVAKDELGAFTDSAIKMGIAFDISGGQAGQMLANWRAGLKLTQPQAESLADVTNYLSNNMNATASAIGDVIQRQGSVAQTAGLATDQIAGLSAALLSSGKGPEVAATALKNLTNALTRGDAATKRQRDAFERLGLDAKTMAKRMQTDASGAIVDVLKRISQLSAAEQPAVLSNLFGEESKGAIAPLLTNLGLLQKAFTMAGDKAHYAGSMQREYNSRSKTTENNLQLLKNKTVAVGIALGTLLLPGLNKVAAGAGDVADVAADLADKFPLATKVIVGTTVALAGMKVASIAGGYGFTFLKGGALSLMKTLEKVRAGMLLTSRATGVATVGMRALAVATVTNPIGAAIAAIAVGGLLIYKYWKPIKAFFEGLWSGLESAAGPVGAAMGQIFDTLGPVGDGLEAVGHGVKAVIGWLGSLLGPVDTSKKELDSFRSKGEAVGKAIGDAFAAMARRVASIVKWVMDKIHAVGSAYEKVKSVPGAVGGKIKGVFDSAASTVGGWFGMGGGDDQPPSIGKANDRRPTYGASGDGAGAPATPPRGGQHPTDSTTNHFTIVQQPGEDSEALADRVADKVEERQQARKRTALYDHGPSYGY